MIFDQHLLFSDKQSVVGNSGSSVVSTNVVDFGAATFNRDLGVSKIPLRVQVVEAVAGAGASLSVSIETSDAENFGTATTIAQSRAVPVASLQPGFIFEELAIPVGANKRYVRLKYNITGANITAGKVTAGVVHGHDFSRYRT